MSYDFSFIKGVSQLNTFFIDFINHLSQHLYNIVQKFEMDPSNTFGDTV